MKPILFNVEMVRAILEGRKTVTRRKAFQMPSNYNELKGLYRDDKNRLCVVFQCLEDPTTQAVYAPCQTGDILWVRETWERLNCCCCEGDQQSGCFNAPDEKEGCYVYRASHEITGDARWRPSIHMPKEAARLFLRVTAVRVERLQDIAPKDVELEGLDWVKNPLLRYDLSTMRSESSRRFALLWDSTIKPAALPLYGWAANPWVWVVSFERISAEEARTG